MYDVYMYDVYKDGTRIANVGDGPASHRPPPRPVLEAASEVGTVLCTLDCGRRVLLTYLGHRGN